MECLNFARSRWSGWSHSVFSLSLPVNFRCFLALSFSSLGPYVSCKNIRPKPCTSASAAEVDQKIHRHVVFCAIHPPAIGPMADKMLGSGEDRGAKRDWVLPGPSRGASEYIESAAPTSISIIFRHLCIGTDRVRQHAKHRSKRPHRSIQPSVPALPVP